MNIQVCIIEYVYIFLWGQEKENPGLFCLASSGMRGLTEAGRAGQTLYACFQEEGGVLCLDSDEPEMFMVDRSPGCDLPRLYSQVTHHIPKSGPLVVSESKFLAGDPDNWLLKAH